MAGDDVRVFDIVLNSFTSSGHHVVALQGNASWTFPGAVYLAGRD